MWPFDCSACKEKNERIGDLKDQIVFLRGMLNPPQKVNKYEIEEDVILSGGGEEERATPISEEDLNEKAKQVRLIQLEENQILSGDTMELDA